MKKFQIVFLFLIINFIVACSSPPQPTPFPDTPSQNVDTSFFYQPFNQVPLNSYAKNQSWAVYWYLENGRISSQESIKFWYLAQNSTQLILIGKSRSINDLKNLLMANGTISNIILRPCTQKNCTNAISIYFLRKGDKK
ncbi:hypothetical protein A6A19_00330 [Actinobacillus delphinicola]|uniref:cag pathogenicity island Cag12 family protein n=1 Tax=Actinobacillus delphinicola TaxID=51161 RepID=UPI00244341A4|nr:cag pathogenicity island Cag12 family protein [Actinobacillus delphinicola]MDG6896492.1 hypothetical protein [Actinobacillus delphinicola]